MVTLDPSTLMRHLLENINHVQTLSNLFDATSEIGFLGNAIVLLGGMMAANPPLAPGRLSACLLSFALGLSVDTLTCFNKHHILFVSYCLSQGFRIDPSS